MSITRYTFDPAPDKMVWVFAGGPGEASADLFQPMLEKLAISWQADVYAMNLRGVAGVDVRDLWTFSCLFSLASSLVSFVSFRSPFGLLSVSFRSPFRLFSVSFRSLFGLLFSFLPPLTHHLFSPSPTTSSTSPIPSPSMN
jgi:hypothetical protein